jgi:hypothetical protein
VVRAASLLNNNPVLEKGSDKSTHSGAWLSGKRKEFTGMEMQPQKLLTGVYSRKWEWYFLKNVLDITVGMTGLCFRKRIINLVLTRGRRWMSLFVFHYLRGLSSECCP